MNTQISYFPTSKINKTFSTLLIPFRATIY